MDAQQNRQTQRRYIAAILLLTLMGGCSQRKSAFNLPGYFVIPNEARDVRVSRSSGRTTVSFTLDAHFPAAAAVGRVREQLARLGWRPLERDWLNPSIQASHGRGWQDFYDRSTGATLQVHQWTGQWENSAGDLVAYSFRFSEPGGGTQSPVPTPVSSELHVSIGFVPAVDRRAIERHEPSS
jgi:hypothetical protein